MLQEEGAGEGEGALPAGDRHTGLLSGPAPGEAPGQAVLCEFSRGCVSF